MLDPGSICLLARRHSLRLSLLVGVAAVLAMAGCKSGGNIIPAAPDGKLAGCPASPNCVSTEGSDAGHRIEPLPLTSSPDDALHCLQRIITGMKRTTIVRMEKGYIHAEYRTRMGFVDDVEFRIDEESRTIGMRSASRIGYQDFGVNRERLEQITARFAEECR